jgi:hypothetical protein
MGAKSSFSEGKEAREHEAAQTLPPNAGVKNPAAIPPIPIRLHVEILNFTSPSFPDCGRSDTVGTLTNSEWLSMEWNSNRLWWKVVNWFKCYQTAPARRQHNRRVSYKATSGTETEYCRYFSNDALFQHLWDTPYPLQLHRVLSWCDGKAHHVINSQCAFKFKIPTQAPSVRHDNKIWL